MALQKRNEKIDGESPPSLITPTTGIGFGIGGGRGWGFGYDPSAVIKYGFGIGDEEIFGVGKRSGIFEMPKKHGFPQKDKKE